MQQLTRDRKSFLRWGQRAPAQVTTATDDSIVTKDGVSYKILTLDQFSRLLSRWSAFDIACFTFGAALVAFCAGYTISTGKPPTIVEKIVTVEKPLIIEKPVPVNAGCLAFCNR